MDIVRNMYKNLKAQSVLVGTLPDYRVWRQQLTDTLTIVIEYENVQRDRLSVGVKRRLTTLICRLKNLNVLMRKRFLRIGDCGVSRVAVSSSPSLVWQDIESAFRNCVITGAVINVQHKDPRIFLNDSRHLVVNRVTSFMNNLHSCIKVNVVLEAEFVLQGKTEVKAFSTRNYELFGSSDLRKWYPENVMEPILSSMEEFQEHDSGWALSRILHLIVNLNKFQPLHAGCNTVDIPMAIRAKKATVNIASNDNACFFWAVIAGLYKPLGKVNRTSSYPHYSNVLRTEGFQLPMRLKEISRFEKENDISVNVYTWDNDKCIPFLLSERKRERHVNLLLLVSTKDPNERHFVCIKNLSRLISRQLSKNKHAKYICDRCLHYFSTQGKLDMHEIECRRMNGCAIILPSEEDKCLRFQNHSFKLRTPFVIYADLECTREDVAPEQQNRNVKSSLIAYQKHRAFSIGYYVSCAYDKSLSFYKSYRNETGSIEWFVRELRQIATRLEYIFGKVVPKKPLTADQLSRYQEATICHICEKSISASETKIRDHCHLTGNYRGAAHICCNLNYQNSYVVPVVFHNLSGYDAHLIVKEIANAYPGHVDLLPITKEKYISFTKHMISSFSNYTTAHIRFRFIDSLKFLNSSLDKLASYLPEDKLYVLRNEYKHLTDADFKLLTRKGIFPYDFVNSYKKLAYTCLPSREMFYSKLYDEHISDMNYQYVCNVWSRFHIKSLGDYSDLYLKVNVLLLADVFENFRDDCIANYNLDPTHYYTLPGFTWDAMLKHTGVELELLTDIDMLMFVERGFRGGLSQCSHRYARANNKYLPSYDPSKPSTYLMYFDVNDLYGWAMSQPLPYGGFRWLDEQEIAGFDVNSIACDSPTGYMLEVDLQYNSELHDLHADLPFCPTHSEEPDKKLLATVRDKERYVIHYMYLQQCMKHGLKLTKVHRVLQFQQCKWLSGYIDLNTRLCMSATNEFSKSLFKFMNNAVFGKTMENVRNHVDVKLIKKWDGRYGAEAYISKPNFHSRSIFSENLMAIELRKLQVKYKKPIYVGACILDMAKICLYSFHYDYMLPEFGNRCKMLYTDTDCLIYEITCDDVYDVIKRDIARFDTSDYANDNPFGIPRTNKKVPGLMKDQNNGAIMTEFVGLRAKVYATRVHGVEKFGGKAKGVKSNISVKNIEFDDYINCLDNYEKRIVCQKRRKSKQHTVYAMSENKLGLSPYDTKRYILSKSTSTLPWGHYSIN